MEESQKLLTQEEEGLEEFTHALPRTSPATASPSVPAHSMTYFPPLETVPLGPPPEYTAHSPAYADKPFPVLLQDGRQCLLVRDPTGMHVVCIDADSTNINNNVQPNDHRCLAILAILCACFPLGIVAIWQSLEVNRRYANGDYRGALRASQAAYKWSVASILLTLTTTVLFLFIRFYFHEGYQYKHY